jgi:hypothetical protein
MRKTAQDREDDRTRREAYRLAFAREFDSAADIEAHLSKEGLPRVAEALASVRSALESVCGAPVRPKVEGILGMFRDD